jgi:O-antigen/teichoic acid export membrane protein
MGVVRLTMGVVLVDLGWGVSGAVAATILAQVAMMLLVYSVRHELFGRHRHAPAIRTKLRDAVLSVGALAGYTSLIGIDTFMANHYFDAKNAGDYAAVAVGAHTSFFVPAALVTVVFPHLADGKGVSRASRRIFRHSMVISLSLGILATAVMIAFPRLTIDVLFGSKYAGASGILGFLALESVMIGVIILYVYLHLARRSLASLTSWVGVVMVVVAVAIFHASMRQVAVVMVIVSTLTLLLIVVPTWRPSTVFKKASHEILED